MNLAGLRELVKLKTNTVTNDGTLTPPALDGLVNEANLAVCADRDWPWLRTTATFSTVSGTGDYTPPADWIRTLSVRVVDEQQMVLLTPDDLDGRYPDSATRGTPSAYAVDGSILRLRAIPNGVFSVLHRYVKVPALLVNDADIPDLPPLFHPILAEYACALAFRRIGDDTRAVMAKAEVDEWRRRMLDDMRRTKQTSSIRVRAGGQF